MRRFISLTLSAGLVAAIAVAFASASSGAIHKKNVTPTAETANAYLRLGDTPCTNNWMQTGCDFGDTSFSHLTQINKTNVGNLKIAWSQGYGDPAYTGPVQSMPLCCANNMMYVASSNTAEAVNPATGAILWTYKGVKSDTTSGGPTATNQQIDARGMGYDAQDNLLFFGQQDSSIAALNAKTGEAVWTVEAAGAGFGTYGTSTKSESVPFTYYVPGASGKDGLVISAPNGGESPIRGSVSAFDAKTGKLVWRTFTTPDPTQLPFILTWGNPAEAAVGGGPVWSEPAFDPQLRTLLVGTGNTYPYLGRQPGKDLWDNSLLALNADTGALKWYYQAVHHDEWDYDCPHAPSVFNAMVKGKLTPVVADACKNSYAFYLNPVNGAPIYGIPEVANSTLPGYTAAGQSLNNGYPTQPRPVGGQGQLIEHCISAQFAAQEIPGYPTGPDGTPDVLSCDMVSPNSTNWLVKPYYISNGVGVMSRATYDPQNDIQYWCATSSVMIEKNTSATDYHTTIINSGRANYVGQAGTLTALNLKDNTVAWQKSLQANPDGNCYSGTMSTASGLLFYSTKGRTDAGGTGREPDGTALRNSGVNPGGHLYAVDATTGTQLWSVQNPFADLIEAPMMTYMYQGKQYVAEEMYCQEATQGPFKGCSTRAQVVVFSL